MKTFNLKQAFSRLPITQRVEIIASMLMKAILKFCATSKLFEFKNILIGNFSAFEHILDLTSKYPGLIGLSKIHSFKLFQILVI